MNVRLLIPAAGSGRRLGCGGYKALVVLAGEPLLVHTLRRFASVNLLRNAVIVTPPRAEADFESVVAAAFPDIPCRYVPGGNERQDSVLLGLRALDAATEIVVIHDAARPFVPVESILASIDAASVVGAATVAIPSVDTILQANEACLLESTPERAFLWQCQTPQTFQVAIIRDAHERAVTSGIRTTDDATLVCSMGHPVKLVLGSRENLKITTEEDLRMARALMNALSRE